MRTRSPNWCGGGGAPRGHERPPHGQGGPQRRGSGARRKTSAVHNIIDFRRKNTLLLQLLLVQKSRDARCLHRIFLLFCILAPHAAYTPRYRKFLIKSLSLSRARARSSSLPLSLSLVSRP